MRFKLLILYYWLRMQWLRRRIRSRASLERYQQNRLSKHWRWIRQHSPYYAEQARTYPDWTRLPTMEKAEFMEHFSGINTCGIGREEALTVALKGERERNFSPTLGGVTVGLSSGTSGNRGLFLVSSRERAQWVAAILDRVIGFSLRKRRVAFFLRANSNLYSSVRSSLLDFQFFDLLLNPEQHWERLEQVQPDILVAQPSMLVMIAQAREQGRLRIRPARIISVAEVLEDTDRRYLAAVFGRPIDQVYQCTEGFLGFTCREGRLHLNEDFVYFQKKYLDPEHTRFHPILTDFTRRSQPILRYELNDILWEHPTPCPCGSPLLPIQKIEGRSDDTFVVQTRDGDWIALFPDFIRRAMLLAGDDVPPYVVEQTHPARLRVHLAGDPLPAGVETRITQALADLFALKSLLPVEVTFTQSLGYEQGQKLRRVRRSCTIPPESRF